MVNVNNIKPSELNFEYTFPLADPFDETEIVKTNIASKIFQPNIQGHPVSITDDKNNPITEVELTDAMLDCCGDFANMPAEDHMREILSKTMTYYDPTLPFQNIYATQAGVKAGFGMPTPTYIYTATDVIDASKQFYAGTIPWENFFANVAFYTRVETMGYYFANSAAWDDFKKWFAQATSSIQQFMSPDTISLCRDLQTLTLSNLTESLILRSNWGENNEPYSFARILMLHLKLYKDHLRSQNQPDNVAGFMPFGFQSMICPKTVVIMNVEKHAHAHPNDIKKEWKIIQDSLLAPLKVVNLKKLSQLTATQRMAQRLAAVGFSVSNTLQGKSGTFRFRKTPMTSTDLAKYIMKIYKKTSKVLTSENTVKIQKLTYNRPNRREPWNIDRQGKKYTVVYRPDIHLYIDCSGSISERQYQDAVKACIKLAKKMNVNMYFNSFADFLSNTTKLDLKDKTTKQIYRRFQSVPKVHGGTNYEPIWHYINKSKKRSEEVSIVITDFEWWPPNHYVKHPRFLYYAPISTSDWPTITQEATSFCRSMLNLCPSIRQHVLI